MEKIKNKPDQILEDIQKLIELVQNTEKEQLESVLDQHFKRYDGNGILSGENLKKYLKQLQDSTEALIQKDFELGKKFYKTAYIKSIKEISKYFSSERYESKNDDLVQLYKDICKQIIDFATDLEECGYDISIESIYIIYANYFINSIVEQNKDFPASPSNHPDEVIARIDRGKAERFNEGRGEWYTLYAPNREEEQEVIRDKVEKAGDKISPNINKEKLAEKIIPYERGQVDKKYGLGEVKSLDQIFNITQKILRCKKNKKTPKAVKETIIFEQMLQEQDVAPNVFYMTMSKLCDLKSWHTLYKGIDISTVSYKSLLNMAKEFLDKDVHGSTQSTVSEDDATEFFKSADKCTALEDAVPIQNDWRKRFDRIAERAKKTFFR